MTAERNISNDAPKPHVEKNDNTSNDHPKPKEVNTSNDHPKPGEFNTNSKHPKPSGTKENPRKIKTVNPAVFSGSPVSFKCSNLSDKERASNI